MRAGKRTGLWTRAQCGEIGLARKGIMGKGRNWLVKGRKPS